MKRFIRIGIIVGALALVGYLVILVSHADFTNDHSKNTGIVAFGDSLVEGRGSAAGGGWVKMLADDLGKPVVNLGVSGNTTADALARIRQVTDRKPAAVIVLLGGNDFLREVPEEETYGNLEKIIQAIQKSGAAVLLVGLESSVSGNHDRELFDALATKYKTAYAPNILDGILGKTELMSDDLHPNDKGYRIMADRIGQVLTETLLKD